jgi:hypothetical protein
MAQKTFSGLADSDNFGQRTIRLLEIQSEDLKVNKMKESNRRM